MIELSCVFRVPGEGASVFCVFSTLFLLLGHIGVWSSNLNQNIEQLYQLNYARKSKPVNQFDTGPFIFIKSDRSR